MEIANANANADADAIAIAMTPLQRWHAGNVAMRSVGN
jgi:hypothetical protein